MLHKNCSDSNNGSKGGFGTEDIAKGHFSGLPSASTKSSSVKNEKKNHQTFPLFKLANERTNENLCKIV